MSGSVLGIFAGEDQGGDSIQAQIIAVYDELRTVLYANLIFQGFEQAEADDVIQEVFLELYRHLRGGSKIHDKRSWLFRAVYNRSLNARRQQRKIGLRGEAAEIYLQQLPARGLNPEQELLRMEQVNRYETALDTLTSQQKQCLLLRSEGLRYREIAAALGISTSRVPQLLERAMSRLMEDSRA